MNNLHSPPPFPPHLTPISTQSPPPTIGLYELKMQKYSYQPDNVFKELYYSCSDFYQRLLSIL
jgi:hypothetical protein